MLFNYLKVAFRHLIKNKLYLIINTLGMGIAIACAMTAYVLVAYNIEFDSVIDKAQVKNIVKTIHHRRDTDGDPFQELVAPLSLGPAALNDMTGIRRFSRYCSTGGYVSYNNNGFHETIFFADSAFLNMFEPPLISGSYTGFKDQNAVYITSSHAVKYFGDRDPIGETLVVSINGKPIHAVVAGVLKRSPWNSTFVENILMRIEQYIDVYNLRENDWASGEQASTLFELTHISQAPALNKQFDKYVKLRNEAKPEARSVAYALVPFLQSISPNDVRQSDLHLRIPFIALAIFMTLGGIILVIACFNLTNTTLALSLKRMKEIGVRKVIGSSRAQIATQQLTELFITTTVSIVAGFGMSLYLIPEFTAMWQLSFGLQEMNDVNIIVALAVLLVACVVLGGIYPALLASRQRTLQLFKGGKGASGTNLFTRTLLVIQFALCTIVLISGIVFTRNAIYQDSISFGYDKDNIITALIQGPREAALLADAISANPKIERSSPSVHHFAFINAPQRQTQIGSEKFNSPVYDVGPEYFNTVGLTLLSGRSFNALDTGKRTSVVVDENFIKHHHLTDPLETQVNIDGDMFTIIGVVSGHLTDLKSDNLQDYIYRLAKPENYQILVIRGDAASLPEIKSYVDSQWKKLFPDKPLRTDLQSDILYAEADSYNNNLSSIFLFMTVLGSILSISGLYSMASINTHRRAKEIAVRKVLGASVTGILKLINIEFAVILTVAAVLGAAGGVLLTEALLSDLFAQHVGVSVLAVAISAAAVFITGLFSSGMTVWKTANTNPVTTLRSE